jgi:hypothetical protein
VLRGELLLGDIMQVNVRSRATAATHLAATPAAWRARCASCSAWCRRPSSGKPQSARATLVP